MDKASHEDLVREMEAAASEAIQALVTTAQEPEGVARPIERMSRLQALYAAEFPRLREEVDLWETLWLRTDRVREQWDRVEAAARRVHSTEAKRLRDLLNCQRRALYNWSRQHICDSAPCKPSPAHFELGISARRPDCKRLHERIEGLYESISCTGRLPCIVEDLTMKRDKANFAIIYGGGWNESAFSVLREARRFGGMCSFVAFDHSGHEIYSQVGQHTVRVANAGLLRTDEEDRYALAAFHEPVVLHFVCPHQWTGPPAHELWVPLLRSDLTLEIVNDKLKTSAALEWYARESGAELPLIREEGVRQVPVPVNMEELLQTARDAIGRLETEGIGDVVVKPVRGEQKKGLAYFELPQDREAAAAHCARLALESGALVQKRIRPASDVDFNWRVLVALGTDGEPHVVGRFARVGHEDVTEKARDRGILARYGAACPEADALLERLDRASLDAFRAVSAYARELHPDFPWRPLGGGSYHVPYILGIDLIGNAHIMEVNGDEVAGMWVDDQLYPETRGRSSRTVLESAERAAKAYKAALGQ